MKNLAKLALLFCAALAITASTPVKADNPVPPPCAPNCAR